MPFEQYTTDVLHELDRAFEARFTVTLRSPEELGLIDVWALSFFPDRAIYPEIYPEPTALMERPGMGADRLCPYTIRIANALALIAAARDAGVHAVLAARLRYEQTLCISLGRVRFFRRHSPEDLTGLQVSIFFLPETLPLVRPESEPTRLSTWDRLNEDQEGP